MSQFNMMVSQLFKSGEAILETLTPTKCNLIHATMGVSGEAGELLDAVKKHVMYNKKLDIANVVEELGDIEFYLEALRQQLDITREETLAANQRKLLNGRYKTGTYSDEQAQARADKQ